MLVMLLSAAGCSGNLSDFIGRRLGHLADTKFRATLVIAPAQLVATDKGRPKTPDMAAAKIAGEACTLYSHLVRSQPGYSVRSLSREFSTCVLRHGAVQVNCEFEVGAFEAAPGDTAVDIPVSFKVRSLGEAAPAATVSWVAEAAWQAIPREGTFTVRVPARSPAGLAWQFARSKGSGRAETVSEADWKAAEEVFSPQAVRSLALTEACVALAADIEPQVRRLISEDGLARFNRRNAAYGLGLCTIEAAPHEDGIDTLAVLRAAQHYRDGKFLPEHVSNAPPDVQEELVGLARKVCGIMLPKTWRSVCRERLDARPVFISKTTVVLEVPPKTARLTVSRNAFTEPGEELLARAEKLMVEFVAKLNALALDASGIDPAEAEARWRRIAPDAAGG